MGAQTSKRIRYGKTYTYTFFIEIIEIIEIFEWEIVFCNSLLPPLQVPTKSLATPIFRPF